MPGLLYGDQRLAVTARLASMGHNEWMWVLERPCDQCSYDAQALDRSQLAARTRKVAAEWRQLLANRTNLAATPGVGDRTWSVLGYACHVRDVFELFDGRLKDMLKKRKPPIFRDWDPDVAAAKGAYDDADPAKVAYALASNAGRLADLLDRVDSDEWERSGHRSDGASFTVESMARYLLHDVEHHLFDAHAILDG